MKSVALLTGAEGLLALKEEWDSLLNRATARTVFSTWEWQDIWWSVFGGDADLLLITVKDGAAIIGIAPLVKQGNVIRFVGGNDISDYLDIIAARGREQDVLSAVLQHLETLSWDELELGCLRQDSPTLRYLPEIARTHDLACLLEEQDVCPMLNLPGDWETYVGSLGKKDRHELRRKMRRLEGSRSFSWYVAPPTTDTESYAETFLRLCRLSKEEKAAFLEDWRMEEFFRAIIRRFLPNSVLKMYLLEIDGERVAVTLCFDQGEELWLYNSGFDPSYSQLSVGLLLKAFCIKDAIEDRKTRFDFLRGREPYKYDLGGSDTPVYRLRIRKRPD
ncbi:MAG: GNAT family N-acetyltransferase [Chloroflexi bacterium]|nr:GNAT family N-acetyltransferase [Chloroflexota bacterium]